MSYGGNLKAIFAHSPHLQRLLSVINGVVCAVKVCEDVRGDPERLKIVTKEDSSPLTIADVCAQAILNRAILQAFPNDAIVAEEDLSSLALYNPNDLLSELVPYGFTNIDEIQKSIDVNAGIDCNNFWTIDPIDGTRGYIRTPDGQYSICLAYLESCQVELAIIACPAMQGFHGQRGTCFVALKGHGTFEMSFSGEHFKKHSCNYPTDLAGQIICESFHQSPQNKQLTERLIKELRLNEETIKMDSQCKYCLVASGQASIYLRPSARPENEKIWDHAPGFLIVREAGGRVTDFSGYELIFSASKPHLKNLYRGGIVADMLEKTLHQQLLMMMS